MKHGIPSLPPSLPPSLLPSLRLKLPSLLSVTWPLASFWPLPLLDCILPSLPPSLSPSLLPSLPPSEPPSLFFPDLSSSPHPKLQPPSRRSLSRRENSGSRGPLPGNAGRGGGRDGGREGEREGGREGGGEGGRSGFLHGT
ncbi:hypothetical protein Naga_103212g1, partial [Nannochloropsis gaditana]